MSASRDGSAACGMTERCVAALWMALGGDPGAATRCPLGSAPGSLGFRNRG